MNNSVYIIGGGYSLKGFDFNKLKDKTTIAVNKSCKTVPNLNYFITMDFTALKKIGYDIIAPYLGTTIFIANFTKPYLKEQNGHIIDTRFGLIYKLNEFNMIIKSWGEKGMGFEFRDFYNGNNSGFCALQLAILLGYTEINLLGIDLVIDKETHWHGGYGEAKESFKKKLDEYYKNFIFGLTELKEKRPNIKVYSYSKISRLNNILEYKKL